MGNNLELRSTNYRAVSLREKSNLELTTAIHSPHDPGRTLDRVNKVLGLYYEPGFDMETRAGLREEFVRALSSFPDWAVQRAFDDWVRSMQRRPSPGEIVILVGQHMKPITDEIARRRKDEAEAQQMQARRPTPPDPEAARQIMQRAGFTPQRIEAIRRAPMAMTFAEAEDIASAPKKPHWTETADPNGADMAALRAARANNPLMAAGMKKEHDE